MLRKIFILASLSLIIVSTNAQVVKRVLLEEFTTAHCGFCPTRSFDCEWWTEHHMDNAILISHHANFGKDAMTSQMAADYAGTWDGPSGSAPTLTVDRSDGHDSIAPWNESPTDIIVTADTLNWGPLAETRIAAGSNVAISINGSYNSSTRTIAGTITANFVASPSSGDLRFGLILAEDSVVGDSTGLTSLYDQKCYVLNDPTYPELYLKTSPIPYYMHRHVSREAIFGTWGQAGIIPASPITGFNYVAPFNYVLPLTYDTTGFGNNVSLNNIELVAYVAYHDVPNINNRRILNATHVMLNDITATSISEQDWVNKIKIGPNPTTGKLTLDFYQENIGVININLIDIEGKKIQHVLNGTISNGNWKRTLNLDGLANGIYFIEIISDTHRVTKKIILSK